MALVSLVDAERQWFKAWSVWRRSETPRELAFCAHAIHGTGSSGRGLRQDERFAQNPLVTGAPNVVFYAGTPLRTSDGHAIGTCASSISSHVSSATTSGGAGASGQSGDAALGARRGGEGGTGRDGASA